MEGDEPTKVSFVLKVILCAVVKSVPVFAVMLILKYYLERAIFTDHVVSTQSGGDHRRIHPAAATLPRPWPDRRSRTPPVDGDFPAP